MHPPFRGKENEEKSMERSELYRMVLNSLLAELAKTGDKNIPAAVSNRHIHLSRADVIRLFGAGYPLKPVKDISQPGQYACEERVTLIGPKGTIDNVRVLGPEYEQTQVEVSAADASLLGIKPVVRVPGYLLGTPGIRVKGPAGEVSLHSGVIVPARHIHMSEAEASAYGYKDKDRVRLRKTGVQAVLFDNVIVCVSSKYSLEAHLNTDECLAAAIQNGEILEVI